MGQFHLIDHPLITHKLTIMRNKKTGSKDFRELLNEISMLMGYELTRDLPLQDVTIETPITKMTAKMVSGRKLAIVPILRAGLGMVDGMVNMMPNVKVGHIGLFPEKGPGSLQGNTPGFFFDHGNHLSPIIQQVSAKRKMQNY